MRIPVIDDKVRERELMRVENERCQAQCERRNPEVDEVWDPQRDGDIQQHYQRAHAQVDTGTSEA